MMFKDRTRRALWLYKVYDKSALLDLNGTSLNSVNTLLALRRRYGLGHKTQEIWSRKGLDYIHTHKKHTRTTIKSYIYEPARVGKTRARGAWEIRMKRHGARGRMSGLVRGISQIVTASSFGCHAATWGVNLEVGVGCVNIGLGGKIRVGIDRRERGS